MLNINESLQLQLNSPVRTIGAVVDISGRTFTNNTELKNFTVDRLGEDSKFFGFGVCQKANVHIRDMDRQVTTTTSDSVRIGFNNNVEGENVWCFPHFYITETHRDENTNELSRIQVLVSQKNI